MGRETVEDWGLGDSAALTDVPKCTLGANDVAPPHTSGHRGIHQEGRLGFVRKRHWDRIDESGQYSFGLCYVVHPLRLSLK